MDFLPAGSRVGLLPCAFGGSEIERWRPPGDRPAGDLFRAAAAAVQRGRAAGGVLRGVLWHQGESDAGSREDADRCRERLRKGGPTYGGWRLLLHFGLISRPYADQSLADVLDPPGWSPPLSCFRRYPERLRALLAGLRAELGADVPLILGELGLGFLDLEGAMYAGSPIFRHSEQASVPNRGEPGFSCLLAWLSWNFGGAREKTAVAWGRADSESTGKASPVEFGRSTRPSWRWPPPRGPSRPL